MSAWTPLLERTSIDLIPLHKLPDGLKRVEGKGGLILEKGQRLCMRKDEGRQSLLEHNSAATALRLVHLRIVRAAWSYAKGTAGDQISSRRLFDRRRQRAGHHRDRIGHRLLLGIDDAKAAPEPVDVDAISDLEHMRHVVRDENDRKPALLHVEDQLEHAPRLLDAQRRRRLVHDDHAPREGGRSRNRDALALTARQRLDRLVDVLDRHQSELVELIARKLLHGGAVETAKQAPDWPGRANLAPEEHVVRDRQGGREREVLVDGFDSRLARVDRGAKMHGLAGEPDLARVRDDRATESLDQRRFASAIVADHGEDLVGIEIEVGMV